jgi:CheY-like chemotaxis protein
MANETVMVVDDDVLIREMVMQILAGEGFAPVGARNGEEALCHLRQGRHHPALILLDLTMPVMDGWRFRAEQLKDPELARIPVVVMSASGEEIDADDRLDKPFEIEELLETVCQFTNFGGSISTSSIRRRPANPSSRGCQCATAGSPSCQHRKMGSSSRSA